VKKLIGFKTAGTILITLLLLLLAMHVLILLRVLPYNIVWGGRIEDPASIVPYETGAMVVMLIFLAVAAIRIGYIRAGSMRKAAGVGMWIVFAYFVLNTVGNFASAVSLENLIFGPLSIVLALLSLRVAIGR
jgi:hypothetical protein